MWTHLAIKTSDTDFAIFLGRISEKRPSRATVTALLWTDLAGAVQPREWIVASSEKRLELITAEDMSCLPTDTLALLNRPPQEVVVLTNEAFRKSITAEDYCAAIRKRLPQLGPLRGKWNEVTNEFTVEVMDFWDSVVEVESAARNVFEEWLPSPSAAV